MSETTGAFADTQDLTGAGTPLHASPNGGGPRPSGVSPLVLLGVALLLGILLAKVVDWRSHAHPRG